MKGRGVRVSLDVGDDTPPLEAVRGIRECLEGIKSGLHANVARARAAGHSWKEIADALGVTRQAAWERFGKGDERDKVIASVLGSLKRPPGTPTLEDIRAEEREGEAEREERKWGDSPPGLKWR
jgi:hypothetical protein